MHAPMIPALSFNLAVLALAFVWSLFCVVRKWLSYNKLVIFKVAVSLTLKMANTL